MKPILSERNIVILLFIIVLTTFVLAQEDSRKMQLVQVAATAVKPQNLLAEEQISNAKKQDHAKETKVSQKPQ